MNRHFGFLFNCIFLFSSLSCERSHSLDKFHFNGIWAIKNTENISSGTRCISFSMGDGYVYFSDSTGFFDTGIRLDDENILIDFKFRVIQDSILLEGDKGFLETFQIKILNENEIRLFTSSGISIFLYRHNDGLKFKDEITSYSLKASPISYYCSYYEFFCSKDGEMVFKRNGEVRNGNVGDGDIHLGHLFSLLNKVFENLPTEVVVDSIYQSHVRSYNFSLRFKSGFKKEYEFVEHNIPPEFRKLVVFSDNYFIRLFERE